MPYRLYRGTTKLFQGSGIPRPPPDQNINKITINFLYEAVNLIKTYNEFPNDKENIFLNSSSLKNDDGFIPLDVIHNYNHNNIIWKIFNKNSFTPNENVRIEFLFDLGSDFEKYDVIFNLGKNVLGNTYSNGKIGFIKSVIYDEENRMLVKYKLDGILPPQDIMIVDVNFPLYFENCNYKSMNMFIIVIGAIFLIVVVAMLYIIFASIILDEL